MLGMLILEGIRLGGGGLPMLATNISLFVCSILQQFLTKMAPFQKRKRRAKRKMNTMPYRAKTSTMLTQFLFESQC